jgi:serine protease Do
MMKMKAKIGVPLFVLFLWLAVGAENSTQAAKPLTDQERDLVTQINNIFRRAVEQVGPAVVSLQVQKDTPNDLIHQDLNQGLGSGCIIDQRGYVITNNHVVADTDKVRIILADGRQFLATEKYFDPDTDLAIVKFDPKDPLTHKDLKDKPLPAATWGDSNQLHVGDMVLAMGNPFGLEQTITSGIVSYMGRQTRILGKWGYEDFIQTDAAINKGNSGGPLVNLYGEVVGVNSNILTPTGVSAGYGFSVPSKIARRVAEQLIKNKQVVRGWLGVKMIGLNDAWELKEITEDRFKRQEIPERQYKQIFEEFHLQVLDKFPKSLEGIWVTEVLEDSPAAKGGLKDHDVIVKLEGKEMADSKALRDRIAALPPDYKVRMEIWREGKKKQVEVTLGDRSVAQKAEEQENAKIAKRQIIPDLENWPNLPGLEFPDIPKGPVKLGVIVRSLTEETAPLYGYAKETQGIVITHVYENTVAEESGLKVGDIILEVDGKKVGSTKELKEIISGADLENDGVKMKIRNSKGTKIRVIKRGAI